MTRLSTALFGPHGLPPGKGSLRFTRSGRFLFVGGAPGVARSEPAGTPPPAPGQAGVETLAPGRGVLWVRGSSDPLPPEAASSIVAGLGRRLLCFGLRRFAAPPEGGSEDPRTQGDLEYDRLGEETELVVAGLEAD